MTRELGRRLFLPWLFARLWERGESATEAGARRRGGWLSL
uniref:Uncharacterized protein n=1 Tax=Arundo donax TaxID=35708 RepID=A0A0A9BHA6_ARUDO